MKVGLLGAGRIGALHAGVLTRDPGVDEILVGDADPQHAEKVAAEVGGQAGRIEAVLDAGPDAVVIAASTPAHAPLIRVAIEAGIPAFCEKPIALGYEETGEIAREVEASGATLQVGFQRRFDAGYVEARRLVVSGALGTIYSVRLATHDPDPPPEEYIPTSGGIFRDLHIHDFDILRWLTGAEVEEVYATGSVRNFGVVAVLTGGRHDPLGYDVRAEVFGSKDSVAVGMDTRTPLRSVEPGIPPSEKAAYPNFQERFLQAYTAEMEHFLALVRGEVDNPCTAVDALEALRIAMAADLSLAEHRPVSLSEVG